MATRTRTEENTPVELDIETDVAVSEASEIHYEGELAEWDDEFLVRRGNYLTLITPEIAEKLLERNTNNRRPKARLIAEYARSMASGVWDPDASDLKFARTGDLIDGQNRLMACVQAGVPFPTLVRTGASLKAKSKVDTGGKRSAADAVKMTFTEVTYPVTLGAAVTLRVRYENAAHMGVTKRALELSRLYMTHDEIIGYIREHPSVKSRVNDAHRLRREVLPTLPQSSLCAFLSMADEVDHTLAQEFYEKLMGGEYGGAGDPMLALINYASFVRLNQQGSPGSRGRAAAEAHLLAMCRAWNAWRSGESFDRKIIIKVTDKLVMPA